MNTKGKIECECGFSCDRLQRLEAHRKSNRCTRNPDARVVDFVEEVPILEIGPEDMPTGAQTRTSFKVAASKALAKRLDK